MHKTYVSVRYVTDHEILRCWRVVIIAFQCSHGGRIASTSILSSPLSLMKISLLRNCGIGSFRSTISYIYWNILKHWKTTTWQLVIFEINKFLHIFARKFGRTENRDIEVKNNLKQWNGVSPLRSTRWSWNRLSRKPLALLFVHILICIFFFFFFY
jgi:hypothetical protein